MAARGTWAPAGLSATIESYNADVEAGTDAQFGKTIALGHISTAPYYALEISGAIIMMNGGLVTNSHAQVLRAIDGEPIPGLYAIGSNAARQTSVENYICGTNITGGFVFGRQAVEHMLFTE